MLTQLNPSIPVLIKDRGTGEAIAIIDYSKEDDLIFVVALDDGGEVWCVPNQDIRLIKNYTIGRKIKDE